MEFQLASKNSERDATAAELESTEPSLCFDEDAVSFMAEQIQSQRLQLWEVKVARFGAKAARTALDSNVAYCIIVVLQGKVTQLTRRAGEFGDEVTRMHQEYDRKVEDVGFKRTGL